MKSLKYVLAAVTLSLIAACGPNLGDATKLGFESVEQMKKLQANGFKTMDDFIVAESKRLGFDDVAEMKTLQADGFNSKEQALAAAKSKGFNDLGEMLEAKRRGFSSKVDYDNFLTAEKKRLEEIEKKQEIAKWQKNFFDVIVDYHEKTKLINNTSGYGFGKNLDRSEQEKFDSMMLNAKKVIKEAIGKVIFENKCWYLGRQSEADEELWCYDGKYDYDTKNFLFKVKISANDAKAIGRLYKNDAFLFDGNITELDFVGVTYSGGRVEEQPIVINIKAIKITRVNK